MNANIERLNGEIQEKLGIFVQTLPERDAIEREVRNALALANDGNFDEREELLLAWSAIGYGWDDIVNLLCRINSLVREPNRDTDPKKNFGFSAIVEKVNDEILTSVMKRKNDHKLVTSLINDVAGTYGFQQLSNDRWKDDEIRQGLTSSYFREFTDEIRKDINNILCPMINDSKSLRDHLFIVKAAIQAAASEQDTSSNLDGYLSSMCPEALERLNSSHCQYAMEAKRSLMYIALRLELNALKDAYGIETEADDDDLY